MAKKPYQDYEENPWKIDSARYKFAPYLIVHCSKTEQWGTITGTTQAITSVGGLDAGAFGTVTLVQP